MKKLLEKIEERLALVHIHAVTLEYGHTDDPLFAIHIIMSTEEDISSRPIIRVIDDSILLTESRRFYNGKGLIQTDTRN